MAGVVIERRAYTPSDITPEIAQAIKDRLIVRPDGLILWKDLPIMSLHTTNIMMEHFLAATKEIKQFRLLVDISETEIPSADLRERYKSFFRREYEKGRFKALAYVTGKNFLINAAARFVAAAIGVKPYSIHKTVPEAIAALEAVQ